VTNPPPPQPLTERFAAALFQLSWAVGILRTWKLLSYPIADLIGTKLRRIKFGFARLAARIEAGTYQPRRSGKRTPPQNPKPRAESPIPQTFGWLMPLVKESNSHRAWVDNLLRDPEMEKLMAAAPAPMARLLRPLCWMLRIEPPAILARPKRPRPPKPPTPPQQKPAKPTEGIGKWPHDPRRRDKYGFYIGPPPFLPFETGPRGPPRKKPA
jgi:hypothetical protein